MLKYFSYYFWLFKQQYQQLLVWKELGWKEKTTHIDFCLVGELSGRRFVISNGKFDGDFTFYSHTNVKVIDEWSLTTFDKGNV